MFGDFNARIGNELDYIVDDTVTNIPNMEWYESSSFNKPRKARDTTVNLFGKSLEICKTMGMCVLNGRAGKDCAGDFTYICTQGASTIDYIVTDHYLFDILENFEILPCDNSNHFPLVIDIKCIYKTDSVDEPRSEHLKKKVNFKWQGNFERHFLHLLQDPTSLVMLQEFNDNLNDNITDSVDLLTNVYQRAAVDMKQNRRISSKNHDQPVWWDDKCAVAKHSKSVALNIYRRSGCLSDLNLYRTYKKDFRKLCKKKQFEIKQSNRDKVELNVNKPKMFWKNLKRLCLPSQNTSDISVSQWFEHFKTLLNPDTCINKEFMEEVDHFIHTSHNVELNEYTTPELNLLNSTISRQEIEESIKTFAIGKSSGVDGISLEMIKASTNFIMPYILSLFNRILHSRNYPPQWCQSILYPLHKGGARSNPQNYRGLSLLSVWGKIFCKVLNNRLLKRAQSADVLYEAQAGYKKGYSTIDNIFVLQSLAQKYISKPKGRYYVLFVDFSEAFDKVSHKLLWYKILKYGLSGNILTVLRNMYTQFKSCVSTPVGLTDYFSCGVGTRQGCVLESFSLCSINK